MMVSSIQESKHFKIGLFTIEINQPWIQDSPQISNIQMLNKKLVLFKQIL